LTQKKQKVKTKKTFSPQGQLPARFFVGRLRALGFLLVIMSCAQNDKGFKRGRLNGHLQWRHLYKTKKSRLNRDFVCLWVILFLE